LKHGKFMNIAYNLGDVHPSRIDGKIFVQGARWANPSEDDFKKKITKFRHNTTVPKQWATELKQHLSTTNSFDAVSKAYDEALKGII